MLAVCASPSGVNFQMFARTSQAFNLGRRARFLGLQKRKRLAPRFVGHASHLIA